LYNIELGGPIITGTHILRLPSVCTSDVQKLCDTFVRGEDLVARYSARPSDGLSCQIDWRAIEIPELRAVGVEVLVSVQTETLDARAWVSLESELPCTEVQHILADGTTSIALTNTPQGPQTANVKQIHRPGLLLCRLEKGLGLCALMVHPTDFVSGQLVRDDATNRFAQSVFVLVQEQMEKGVIRRSRARALFLPSGADTADAIACYERFARSPLPLTA
jgi:hypothetical protein